MSFRLMKNRVCYRDRPVHEAPGALTLLDANAETALLLIDPDMAVADNILLIDKTGHVLWRIAHPFGDDGVFLDAAQVAGSWYAYRADGMCYAFDPLTGQLDVMSGRMVA